MRRILPSLTALQCFEAAARHSSITRAAEELNMTQSAVSRQIRNLEDFLQRKLFRRVKQRIVLTPVGEVYAGEIRAVLDRAETATVQVMAYHNRGGLLTVACLPTFGSRWLVPRLSRFTEKHPDIQLNLITQIRPFDFSEESADIAIHFGAESWPGAQSHRLMGEDIAPVCAPRLLEGRGPLTPDRIREFTLLQHSTRPRAWQEWCAAEGVTGLDAFVGPRFEHFHLVAQAAVAGLGMAILPLFLIQDELASGALVRPFAQAIRSSHSYYVVYPDHKADLPGVRAFRDWILSEAAETLELVR
ncbi:transcriptional regulator GcvA [Novispirillum itersonii]|uniref:DNA-binding transcriptional LysR family regulator n=1 Tax=Novispirillum itersonii TaxID=189 RepID=A0A7W9ZHV5_NOVIT|nr:transcriptional regulator GcvA [Novispirillum itersonii]MBB6211348.1 DNA-binding transcriptional LysR family regulator [Novispirillum itersonii]